MEVLVCGGGIVGLAAAHALAERGAEVILCERGSLGGGRHCPIGRRHQIAVLHSN